MAGTTPVHFRPSITSSFESTLCFGLPDPTTVLILEVVLKYKRWILLTNRRGEVVDFLETSSDDYACFHSPGLSSYCELRAQIRLWLPGLSPPLCSQLSQRIFEYAQQVAFANARHHLSDVNGGANKVTAFVEIEEPQLQPSDDVELQRYTGVRTDFDDDGGIVLYFDNDDGDGIVLYIDDDDDENDDDDDGSSKPPRGLSLDEINRLKQESFKNGTDAEEESLMCSICLEEFLAGVKITPLSCSHTFHYNCIASWLQKQGSCPFCRFDITQEYS